MGQRKRDDAKARATSANVVPLWPATIHDDMPMGYLEQVARRVRANLTDLVATADTYNLELATEFRIAAELLQQPSGTTQPLQIAESTGLRLANGTGGCWELTDQNDTVLGLIVAIDGRLVLAPTSWSRREVLAAGGAVLLTPFAGLSARAATTSAGNTSSPPDPEAAERLDYVIQHPRSVDMAAAAHLREQAQSLAKQYDLVASTSLLPAAGECIGQVTFLRKQAPDGPVLRELQATEAELATLMGQLIWDASQRQDHATAVGYYDQAISAANRAGETTAEAYALLRKSYIALYGEQEPQAGLRLAQQAATLAETAGSHALQGLALLHAGEGYALLGDRKQCEAALGRAEAHLQALHAADPAHGLLSADRLGRIQGSCYLALGESVKAGPILESTARRLHGRHKSKAIILGNLALAHVRQRDLEQATTVLHRAIDLLEVSRGGGGLNVVSAAVRELRPWRHKPVVQDVHERLLGLMTLN